MDIHSTYVTPRGIVLILAVAMSGCSHTDQSEELARLTEENAVLKLRLHEQDESSTPPAESKSPSKPEPKPGEVKNFAGIEFAWIPSGTYPEDGKDVLVNGFWMGKYEVTFAQYEAVMDNEWTKYYTEHPVSKPRNLSPDCPAHSITYMKAHKFIEVMNFNDPDLKFRLPSLTEWQYACNANVGDPKAFCFGRDKERLKEYAWYKENSGRDSGGGLTLHPVGQLKPNAWGLHDVHGNVLEWVATGGTPIYVSGGQGLVNRMHICGGSYYDEYLNCRNGLEVVQEQGYAEWKYGFRLAKSP